MIRPSRPATSSKRSIPTTGGPIARRSSRLSRATRHGSNAISAIAALTEAGAGRAYRIVGAMADVTETRQRDRELETAKAEAAASYRQGDAQPGPITANEER